MRACRWCGAELPSRGWHWPLCKECEKRVLEKANQLADAQEPVVYPAFGSLVPQDVLNQGGFWQYDVLNTLERHHGWRRHRYVDRGHWSQCDFPLSRKPETHFHRSRS